MTCGIYKITHPSGLVYVGQSLDIGRRWSEHKKYTKAPRQKVSRAMRDLGLDTFEFAVIEECPADQLDERELYWMRELGALDPVTGLNVAVDPAAPSKGRKVSTETRAKLSAALKGREVSNEHRAKIGAANKGKLRSDETRAKLSAALRGRVFSKEHRENIGAGAKGNKHFLGKKHSDEMRAKMSSAKKGKKRGPLSDETRAKMSAAKRLYWEKKRASLVG